MWELYNLATDRIESHDLAAQEPERLAKLTSMGEQVNGQFMKDAGEATTRPAGARAKRAAAKKR